MILRRHKNIVEEIEQELEKELAIKAFGTDEKKTINKTKKTKVKK